MKDYTLVVIGAGPGGYVAAHRAARLGAKVAVVENRQAGGTCLNRGCVPTKALLHASGLYREALDGAQCGVEASGLRFDPAAAFARKEAVVSKLRGGVETMLKSAKVDLLSGTGTILAPGKVKVQLEGEERVMTCDHILAATGSVPARPPIPGLELPGVMTSDELLAGTDHLPPSIVIIGGGVIGVEFATFYNDLGVCVTVLEGLDRLLPNLDRELGQSLGMLLKKRGCAVQTGAMVERVEQTAQGLCVFYTQKGKPGQAVGEMVLCAIGRKPYTENLFAPGLELAQERGRLLVDASFQTSVPGIYAIGDVSSRVQLAHVASAQGVYCVEKLYGAEPTVDLSVVPGCVYTRPEIASVGLSEQGAKAAGIAVKTGKGLTSANARSVIAGADRGFLKLVARADTGAIIGAHLMCDRATDMISELSQAIADTRTAQDLLHIIRPHPTFEEALHDALTALVGK